MSFPSSSPAANPFLVDSLIGGCRTDSFYSGSSMYMPSASDMGTYGMQTCGLWKRGEVNHQNLGMSVHSYIPQIDNWTEPSSRACSRIESSSQMSNCTFAQSIKEESTCCMYSDKRVHKVSSAELPAYPGAGSESCAPDGAEIPVPGYFRLSQTYNTGKQQDNYCQQPQQQQQQDPPSPSPTLLQLSRVTPKPQPGAGDAGEDAPQQRSPVPAAAQSPEPGAGAGSGAGEEPQSSPELLLQREGKGGSRLRSFLSARRRAPAS